MAFCTPDYITQNRHAPIGVQNVQQRLKPFLGLFPGPSRRGREEHAAADEVKGGEGGGAEEMKVRPHLGKGTLT